MPISLHPGVHADVGQIMAYYERTATTRIADEFYAELRRYLAEAARRPTSFPLGTRGRRRVNLRRFPYHFLFRMAGETVRVLVVRHHRRHPSYGAARR